MTRQEVSAQNKEGAELMKWFLEDSSGLSLRTRLARFNEYLLRKAEESGIPVGQIEISDETWAEGDEVVKEAIREQIEGIIVTRESPPEQLSNPET